MFYMIRILALLLVHFVSIESQQGQDCGGQFTSTSGFIQSPNFPGNYKHASRCVWIVTGPHPHEKFKLTFITLNVEEGNDLCPHDHVIIRDGSSRAAPLLGKFCGQDLPESIWTNGNKVWVEFLSDSQLAYSGFKLKYNSLLTDVFPMALPSSTDSPLTCGEALLGSSGIITSPGYPGPYFPNTKCKWFLNTNSVDRKFEVMVEFVDIEYSVSCGYDWLKFVMPPHSTELITLCGNEVPETIYANELIIEFCSDSLFEKQGFKIHWKTIESDSKLMECHMEQNGFVGMFTSGGYPDNYSNNQSCSWLLKSHSSTNIEVRFTDFYLESSELCEFDFLEIYDGGSKLAPLIGRYCGSEVPDVVRSTWNEMFVYFKTDRVDTQRGFECSWIALSKTPARVLNRRQANTEQVCGGTFTEKIGVIQSPNFPQSYPSSVSCIWIIKSDAYHQLMLEFEEFELEPHSKCRYDYVIIKDGTTRHDEPFGKFCGNNPPVNITASGLGLYIEFISDSTTVRKGFKANWKVVQKSDVSPSQCGGDVAGETGVITSPRYPFPTSEHKICTWTITVPQGGQVSLTFDDFQLEDHPGCARAYVQVRESGENLGAFCGSSLPRLILSKSSSMTIGYLSDLTSRGFKATWRAVYMKTTTSPSHTDTPCGSLLTLTSGFIEHSQPSNCSWTISVATGNTLQLSFIEIKMADDPDCRREQVVVREKRLGSVIMRMCGQLTPDFVVTSSNNAFISHTVFRRQPLSRLKLFWQTIDPQSATSLNSATCGQPVVDAKQPVGVHNEMNTVGTLPWVVAVIGMYGRVHCGGAVISPGWILTAAHCFERLPWKLLWTIRAGEVDLMTKDDYEQDRSIRNIYFHPEYNRKTHDNDVALVQLNKPLTFNHRVRSVCLPSSQHQVNVGERCTVAGWGARKYLRQPKSPLVQVQPPIVSSEKCNSSQVYAGRITERMLCAGDTGIDSCQGDGGSPLTCIEDGRHYAIGLASWGNGCAFPGKYGVYSDTRKFRAWIEYMMGAANL